MKLPNILFIMSDDHAANAISSYGSRLAEVAPTPQIDRIGQEGMVLTNCHCTNAICTPSRASILTGQHPHVNGVRTLADTLPKGAPSFVRELQNAGYQTGLFGKWHVHSEPEGFDDYRVLPAQGLYNDPYFISPGEIWPVVESKGLEGEEMYPEGDRYNGHVTDLTTDFCLEWLRNRETDRPFLLFCHHKAPHDDFVYQPRYEHVFDNTEIPEPESLFEDKSHRSDGSRDFGTTVSDRNLHRNAIKKMSAAGYPTGSLDLEGLDSTARTRAAYQKYLKDYLRCVRGIDDSVGRLLEYLDTEGLTENTIVIYTSDQGMFLGEHDYIDKRWIYEESLRMPFLARFPREIPSGSWSDTVVDNVDFAKTLLDYAGVDPPAEMQGRSFRPVLADKTPSDWRHEVYNRYWMHMTHHDNPAHYGIRTREYKLIFFYGMPLDAGGATAYQTPAGGELYDLRTDPFELQNVYNDPSYREVRRTLKARLRGLRSEIGEDDSQYPALEKLTRSFWDES